jgi:hypothetical protein
LKERALASRPDARFEAAEGVKLLCISTNPLEIFQKRAYIKMVTYTLAASAA